MIVQTVENKRGEPVWFVELADYWYWVPYPNLQRMINESVDPEAKVVELLEADGGAGRWSEYPPDDYTLEAEMKDGCWTVTDTSGGRWWPNNRARAEILASDDPKTAIVEMARETPSRGEWHS